MAEEALRAAHTRRLLDSGLRVKLYALVVTYRRKGSLITCLERLEQQPVQFQEVVVVDNDPAKSAESIICDWTGTLSLAYFAPGENLGPAGGRALGMRHIAGHAEFEDWALMVDDDVPLPRPGLIQELLDFAAAVLDREPQTAGVGLRGGRLIPRAARLISPTEENSPTPVDHLHGGYFPLYRVGPVLEAGSFNASIFFGFTELDLGLRLRDAGYQLFMHSDLFASLKDEFDPLPVRSQRLRLGGVDTRRYYGLRNLLVILRKRGFSWAAVRVSVTHGLLKPLLNLLWNPRLAWAHLRLNVAAIRDAWAGNLGYRYPLPDRREY